jgi:hypothetical protein
VLVFPEFGPRSIFRSEVFRVPAGKRLWIEEVSLFVQLRETTDRPPVKAFAHLTTGQIELDESRRVNVHEPLGTIEWLDKSPPPFVGSTLGMLRTTMSTFVDPSSPVIASGQQVYRWWPFVMATLEMNEGLALASDASDTPLTHVTIVGCFVELPPE